jgi:hypothetical protein
VVDYVLHAFVFIFVIAPSLWQVVSLGNIFILFFLLVRILRILLFLLFMVTFPLLQLSPLN